MKTTQKKTADTPKKPSSVKKQKNTAELTSGKAHLRDSDDFTRILLNTYDESFLLTDSNGIILAANEVYAKRIGRVVKELIGKNTYDLLPFDLRQSRKERINEVIRTGNAIKFVDQRGGLILENTVHPITDGNGKITRLVLYSRDITEYKKNETELLVSRDRLSLIFNNVSEMQLLLNVESDGRLIVSAVNQHFLRVVKEWGLQITESSIIGRERAEVWQSLGFSSALVDEWTLHYRRVIESGVPARYEEDVPTPKGVLYQDVNIVPIFDVDKHCTHLLWTARDITKRKQAEEALRKSEERFSKVFHSSPIPISISRVNDGKILDVNPAFIRHFEYKRDELVGKTAFELNLWVDPADRAHIASELREHGAIHELEKRYRAKSGRTGDMLLSAEVIEFEGEQWLICASIDITERKLAEESIRQQDALLKTFFSQSLDGCFFMMLDEPIHWNDSTDKEQVLDYVFAHQRMTKVNDAMLAQYGMAHEQFIGQTPNDLMSYDVPYGKALWRSLFDNGRLAVKTDERKMDGSPMWIEGEYVCLYDSQGRITGHFGIQREITTQKKMEDDLHIKDSAIGSSIVGICITDFDGKITYANNAWLKMFGHESMQEVIGTAPSNYVQNTADAEAVLEALAIEDHWIGELTGKRHDGSAFVFQLAANMVKNGEDKPIAMLGSFLDITEQKLTEKQVLFQSSLLEKVAQAIIVTDMNGTITYWNKFAETMYGWDSEETLGKNIINITPSKISEAQAKEIMALLSKGKSWSGEFLVSNKAGADFPVFVTDTPLIDVDGKLIGIIGVSMDITERKQAEAALQASEKNYRQLMEQAVDGIFIADVQGCYLEVNSYACELLGYTRAELLQLSIRDIVPADELQSAPLRLDELIEGKTVLSERRLKRKNGTTVQVEMNAKLMGDGRLLAIVRNITERKQTQHALERSEAMLSEAQRISHIGSWELDLQTNYLNWSDEIYRIFEISPQEFDASYEAFLFIIHPEDREAVNLAYTESVENKKPYEITHRLLMKDGRIKYVQEYGKTFYDDEGKPLRSIGTVQDITEHRRMEQELKSERNFMDAILNNANALVVVLDHAGRIRRFNFAAEKLSGFNFTEIEGKYPWDIFLPTEDAKIIRKQAFESLITNPQQLVGSYENYWVSKTGEKYLIEWANSLLFNAREEAEYMVSIGINVTERRKIEEKLRESEDRFSKAFYSSPVAVGIRRLSDDVIIDWNPAFEKLIGYTSEHMFGKRIRDLPFYPKEEDRKPVLEKAERREPIYGMEMQIRNANGGLAEVLMSVDYITLQGEACALASFVDITEHKRSEKKFREIQSRLQVIVDNSPIILFTLDQNGIFTLSEGKGLAVLGLQPGQVTGLSAFDLYSQLPDVTANIRRALAGELITFIARNGPLAFEIHYVPYYDANGQAIGVIGSAFDISAQIQATELIQAQLQEKEVLLKEIHHRVKNNLQVISSLLYLQSENLNTKVKNMFIESQNRVASMALIHEKLYQSEDLAHISFAGYVSELVQSIVHSYGVDESRIDLVIESGDIVLDINHAVPCGLIINEIVSNSLKYAFPENRKGVIRITLDIQQDKRFTLIVSDDGVGFPSDFEQKSKLSLGIRLIDRLVGQLEGTLQRSSSSQGTIYHIVFPYQVY